jgi:hypothetical protein
MTYHIHILGPYASYQEMGMYILAGSLALTCPVDGHITTVALHEILLLVNEISWHVYPDWNM